MTIRSLSRRGFTLIELLVVVAIIALLVSILLPALRSAREAGRQARCMANMQQIGRAHAAYSNDFKQFIAIYNGLAERYFSGSVATPGGVVNVPFPWSDNMVQQADAITEPFLGPANGFDRYSTANEFSPPHEHFSHLVLMNYMSATTPIIPGSACPSDAPRLSWQRSPREMAASPFRPGANAYNGGRNLIWWPLSTSYQLFPTAWMRDGRKYDLIPRATDRQNVLGQSGVHDRYYTYAKRTVQWGQRKITDVSFPSSKAAVGDSQQRHVGKRDLYYAYPEAVQPLLFWDSSVSSRKTQDSNVGWNPRANNHLEALLFAYTPDPAFESPVPADIKSPTVKGHYKWTRGGLKGIDFGAREISTKGW